MLKPIPVLRIIERKIWIDEETVITKLNKHKDLLLAFVGPSNNIKMLGLS